MELSIGGRRLAWRSIAPALPMLALFSALGLLYLPMLRLLGRYHWTLPAHSHGPLVLLAALGLFVTATRRHAATTPTAPSPRLGVGCFITGLLLYAFGMLAESMQVAAASLFPVLAGLSLYCHGRSLLRAQGFAYFFLLFLIPWSPWITDPLTQPMKIGVSWSTELLLRVLGYPVARNGAMLDMGAYRLLVADACAGLNSLFMLEAFGLLYLHLLRHASALRNTVLALLIVPISFTANVLRVLTLALLTFHFGDEVGQGFMHGFSGLLLFAAALLLLAPIDALLRRMTTGAHP